MKIKITRVGSVTKKHTIEFDAINVAAQSKGEGEYDWQYTEIHVNDSHGFSVIPVPVKGVLTIEAID